MKKKYIYPIACVLIAALGFYLSYILIDKKTASTLLYNLSLGFLFITLWLTLNLNEKKK